MLITTDDFAALEENIIAVHVLTSTVYVRVYALDNDSVLPIKVTTESAIAIKDQWKKAFDDERAQQEEWNSLRIRRTRRPAKKGAKK